MKEWKIPIVWQECGIVYVEANTIEEAIEMATGSDIQLPDFGDYVEGSCKCYYDDIELVRDFHGRQE